LLELEIGLPLIEGGLYFLTGQDAGCVAKFLSGPFHSILSFKKYWHFHRKAVHSKIILTRQLISIIEKIKMPHKCCVPICKSNHASSKSSYVSVFKFPSKKIRMQEWMRILKLENWRVNKTSVVCENHVILIFVPFVTCTLTSVLWSLLVVPLGRKSILNYKPVLLVGSIQPSG
jgi:hypothetical protein